MAERYIHGFYSADVFCGLIVRASVIPMDEKDKRVVYRDMLEQLKKFLKELKIAQPYIIAVKFRTLLSKLTVLNEQHPEHKGHSNASVITWSYVG